MGRKIKKVLELDDAPPHEVIQAIIPFRSVIGSHATPVMADKWETWLEKTKAIMPAMDIDTALEKLFEAKDDEPKEWVDTETDEEKEAILGKELCEKIAALRRFNQAWLKDCKED
jgi:hypothetical protein